MAESALDAARFVAGRLLDAGHVAYFAGGCVRDRLRGEDPKDFDVATDATPARIRELFPRAIGVGEAFGVMLVRRSGRSIEIATFRSDGAYQDGRHPESVRFGDAVADAQRRDFTINGLFEDPRTGEIIDHVGGRADLSAGLVRAIGDPRARLDEDRLRTLRAVRFAARFRYGIDPLTRAAIAAAADLHGVSRERVGQEVRRMLADGGRHAAVQEMQRLGLDRSALLEPGRLAATPRVAHLPAGARFEAALVAWLLDRMDAEPARHIPEARLEHWAAALVLSNDERALALAILRQIHALRRDPDRAADAWAELGVAGRKRAASSAGFREALALVAATAPQRAAGVAADVAALEASPGGLAPSPLVTGDDLIRTLRLIPGPAFKAILRETYDAQLEGRVRTREEALALAARRSAGGAG